MMKLKKYIYGVAVGAVSLAMTSCYNGDREYPDFAGGTTAYFAYQFPVRTLILGNDIYDNSLDNAHKCRIWATMGGAYDGRNANVDIVVDETLCDNLWFVDAGGNPWIPVTPMPKEYYTLGSSVIPYNGDHRGYVEVEFTDAFFNDEKAVENTYVIPLLMTSVTGIDHILTGMPREGLTPSRTNLEDWEVLAKDYVLYCVKYMNPWQAKYIRRGLDVRTENGVTSTLVRKDMSMYNSDLEHYNMNPVNQNDEIVSIRTKNMKQAISPVSINIGKDADGATRPSQTCYLLLTFDDKNQCTIVNNNADDATVTTAGSGEFIVKGTDQEVFKEYQWGNINGKPVSRDILCLTYNVSFKKGRVIGKKTVGNKEVDWVLENDVDIVLNDTMVVQTRESNKMELFSPKYVNQ